MQYLTNDLMQPVWNFHNKIVVEFSLISFDTAKWGCVIKTTFYLMINNSVTIRLSFLLSSISAIILSKTMNILRFLFGLYSSIFL